MQMVLIFPTFCCGCVLVENELVFNEAIEEGEQAIKEIQQHIGESYVLLMIFGIILLLVVVEKNIILPTPAPHVPSYHGSRPSQPGTMGIDLASRHPDVAHIHSSSDEFVDDNSGYDDMC